MILSVHATFGAAVASLVPNHPVMGFTLGFLSHFALDAIPHRDYELRSLRYEPKGNIKLLHTIDQTYRFLMDVLTVGTDAFIGFILSFMFFFDPNYPLIFLMGSLGGMLPDFLKFLYLIFAKNKLLKFFDFVHFNIFHTKKQPEIMQQIGIVMQFFTITILIGILYWSRVNYF